LGEFAVQSSDLPESRPQHRHQEETAHCKSRYRQSTQVAVEPRIFLRNAFSFHDELRGSGQIRAVPAMQRHGHPERCHARDIAGGELRQVNENLAQGCVGRKLAVRLQTADRLEGPG
jgi:hypothetical protein